MSIHTSPRLLVLVEGMTEYNFVNAILRAHLYSLGFGPVNARLLGPRQERSRRGGICGWHSARFGIVRHLKEDRTCFISTMVDYYGLPSSGHKAWPGRAAASSIDFKRKAGFVEHAILNDVQNTLGSRFDPIRFLPFVMMHEFEAHCEL